MYLNVVKMRTKKKLQNVQAWNCYILPDISELVGLEIQKGIIQ
jgi:hypothetical protein